MTRQRALRLAREWSQGHGCSLRDGEADEYHAMFATMLEESMPNEPLTIEQLREMNGEPVWVEDVKHWALIDIEKGGQWDGVPFAIWAENGVKFTYNVESRNLHCYRRPPEVEEDNND